MGQPSQVGSKGKEPDLDAAILLTLDITSESTGNYVC